MTLILNETVTPFDGDSDRVALRLRLSRAKERAEVARRELELRRASLDLSLRSRLQTSEGQLAEVEMHFATAIALVREAARLEVERILVDGGLRSAEDQESAHMVGDIDSSDDSAGADRKTLGELNAA